MARDIAAAVFCPIAGCRSERQDVYPGYEGRSGLFGGEVAFGESEKGGETYSNDGLVIVCDCVSVSLAFGV